MNPGKIFELDFKKSVPEQCFYYRFRDGTAAFNKSENSNIRFQAKNICDCMVYNGEDLYLLELKSHKGKSLPLSCIRSNQIKGLLEAQAKWCVCSLIVNFRDIEETYSLDVHFVKEFIEKFERKSIPLSYFQKNGYKIEQIKKRTRYKYDLEFFRRDE